MISLRAVPSSVHSDSRIALSVTLCLWLSGCGGSSSAPAPVVPESAQATAEPASVEGAAQASTTSKSSASGSQTKHRRDEVWVDENGQKWFGNVPMDAFFDSPYEVASNQTPIGGGTNAVVAANTGTANPGAVGTMTPATGDDSSADPAMTDAAPASTPEKTATPSEAPTAAADDNSWTSLITMATLEEEVKSVRNFMNENVQSVGTFNSSMLMIPPKAAALGALASVAMEHSEPVSWKDDAKYVRDLAKKINSAPLQRGAKDQKRVQELYETIADILNRSKPAGLEEPPDSDSFAEVAEMRLLMMRMEDAEKRLKTEAGTESAMGSKKDMIAHEASMMAVMAKIVSMPGYGYGDDAKFTGYASDVVTAAQTIKEAAAANDFAAYESALTKIATTCSKCHSDYKND